VTVGYSRFRASCCNRRGFRTELTTVLLQFADGSTNTGKLCGMPPQRKFFVQKLSAL